METSRPSRVAGGEKVGGWTGRRALRGLVIPAPGRMNANTPSTITTQPAQLFDAQKSQTTT